ncbi:MFS transporter [Gordonia sesuvii]|uniref:MFS transporter n=1 Tax=Gordonia sesuvii TaxID=3116777 RepID=UPI003D671052
MVAVLSLGGLLASVMQTLIVPIIAELPNYLGTTRDNSSWVVTATLVAAAVAMPIAGRLADLFGKRAVMLGCICGMIAGSVLCALTDDLLAMVIGRGFQGVAMGLIPCGISLMRDCLDVRRLSRSVALLSATMGVGGAVGLPVSAWIAQNFDWHALFWCSAALATVVLALMVKVVPESGVRASGGFDICGAVGLSVALICILLTVTKGAVWGWTSPMTVFLGVTGGIVLGLWIWLELRLASPLVDLRTSSQPVILLTNCASFLIGCAMMFSTLATPQLLQVPDMPGIVDGLGQDLFATGLIMAPAGLAMMAFAPISGRLIVVVGPRSTLMVGAVMIMGGYVGLTIFLTEVWQVAIALIVVSSGIGMSYAAMPSLIMAVAPGDQTAAANSLNALMRSAGTSTASAILTTLLATSAIDIGAGATVPGESSFRTAFWVAAGIAAAATAITSAIPYRHAEARLR